MKCEVVGNFIWFLYYVMFLGFMLKFIDDIVNQIMLFFLKDIGFGCKGLKNVFVFDDVIWIKSLENKGYQIICIGGVFFFNNCFGMGKVFLLMFKESYWYLCFVCMVKESMDNQIYYIQKIMVECVGS